MLVDNYHPRKECACCQGTDLERVLELPATPPANEFVAAKAVGKPQETYPIRLLLCRCGHLQMEAVVNPEILFGNYVFVSGTSPVTRKHFADYARTIIDRQKLRDKVRPLVVEIGSNDGTFLKSFQLQGITNVLGVDPAEDIGAFARQDGIPTVTAFFTEALAKELVELHGRASVVAANNVFAHIENLRDVALGAKALLATGGVFVFEVSYLVDVVNKLLFDTIYHEHLSYHTVKPLIGLFNSIGMTVVDIERPSVHGGSLRVYVSNGETTPSPSVSLAIEEEESLGLFQPSTYTKFGERILLAGQRLRDRLDMLLKEGKTLAGFGAPAKLTTLMYSFGLNPTHASFIVDDSIWKQGLFTPGLHIPVLPPEALYQNWTDACVIYAWNFAESIKSRNTNYKGIFINPLQDSNA